MSICLVKQNDGTWVENINGFYSTFTNVFFFFKFLSRFLTFFNVFIFFWNVFYIYGWWYLNEGISPNFFHPLLRVSFYLIFLAPSPLQNSKETLSGVVNYTWMGKFCDL